MPPTLRSSLTAADPKAAVSAVRSVVAKAPLLVKLSVTNAPVVKVPPTVKSLVTLPEFSVAAPFVVRVSVVIRITSYNVCYTKLLRDPVGPPEIACDLAWKFREMVEYHGGQPVFYEVGTDLLPIYLDMGMVLFKLGDRITSYNVCYTKLLRSV